MKRLILSNAFLNTAVACYCLWLSLDLIHAWMDDPFGRAGAWAFVLWLTSVFIASSLSPSTRKGLPALQALAILLATLGLLGELNVLQHVGLAFAICSYPMRGSCRLILLAASISWMPTFGWLGHMLLAMNLNFTRIPLMMLAAIAVFLIHKRQQNQSNQAAANHIPKEEP